MTYANPGSYSNTMTIYEIRINRDNNSFEGYLTSEINACTT